MSVTKKDVLAYHAEAARLVSIAHAAIDARDPAWKERANEALPAMRAFQDALEAYALQQGYDSLETWAAKQRRRRWWALWRR